MQSSRTCMYPCVIIQPYIIHDPTHFSFLGTSCAVILLECATQVGSTSRKLTASVYSSLALAFWRNDERDRALQCMQRELQIAQTLGRRVRVRGHELRNRDREIPRYQLVRGHLVDIRVGGVRDRVLLYKRNVYWR